MPFSNRIYDVDWKRLTRWLVPVNRRKKKFLALLNALTSGVNQLHTRFVYYRNWVNYRLEITPQVVYLEKLLNDRFDTVLKRIRIIRTVEREGVPLFLKEEAKPKKFYLKEEGIKKIFWRKEETEMFTVDFIVQIPILVPFDEKELRAYLDNDVLPSKVYKIQIV